MMDDAPLDRLAAQLLLRALEHTGLIGARLQVELARLQAGAAKEESQLEALCLEMDELGWLLSILSAAGEGQPGLARHHPLGLRILLEFAMAPQALLGSVLPALEACAGPNLAWHLATWLHTLQPSRIQFAQSNRGTWRVLVTSEVQEPSFEANRAALAWFASHELVPRMQSNGLFILELPSNWLDRDSSTTL